MNVPVSFEPKREFISLTNFALKVFVLPTHPPAAQDPPMEARWVITSMSQTDGPLLVAQGSGESVPRVRGTWYAYNSLFEVPLVPSNTLHCDYDGDIELGGWLSETYPPSEFPSSNPSSSPSVNPSELPTTSPSRTPSQTPSLSPTTSRPTYYPTRTPSRSPSVSPSKSNR